MDGLTFLSIALIWVVLQFWLLPKLGITWATSECDGSRNIHKEQSKDPVDKNSLR